MNNGMVESVSVIDRNFADGNGRGTAMFYVMGFALLAMGALLILYRKKRRTIYG